MKALVRFVNVRQLGKRALSVVLLLPLCACAFAQETWQKAFSSPNGKSARLYHESAYHLG